MAKKASKPISKKKKVASKPKHAKLKAKIKRRIAPSRSPFAIKNLEEALLSKLNHSDLKKESVPVLLELLYNLTPSTRNMGYNYGFHLGIKISEMHNSANTIHPLLNALSNAGFSNLLYYPHKNSVVIEAMHHQDCKMNLNATLHILEAGMIAGYLSHSTGLKMNAIESRCAHGSKGKCQFTIEQINEINAPNTFEGTSEIESSIKDSMQKKSSSAIPTSYFMLAISPLTKSPIQEQLSKLLFIVGQGVSKDNIAPSDSNLGNLAFLFSLQNIKASRKGKRLSSLLLNFKKESSIKEYADLISPFFSGLLYSATGKLPKISLLLGRDQSYSLELKAGK